jgi:hypothetical protein
MALVRPHNKETEWRYCEDGTTSEFPRSEEARMPQKDLEEEANKSGKTWSKIKRLAKNGKGWKCFTAALFCTTKSDRN